MNDSVIFSTKARCLRISPQKMRVVSNFLLKKKLKLNDSISLLYNKGMLLKKGGRIILKLLSSLDKRIKFSGDNSDFYFIENILINKSFMRKKTFFRAKGRSDMIRNRYSSVDIVVSRPKN